MDLHTGEIVACQMKRRPVLDLVSKMLDQSIKTLSPATSCAATCHHANLRHHGAPPRQDRAMQQYLLLIYIEPALLQALPSDEFNALMRDCLAHADQLQAEGTLLAAQKLQPVDTAQTLRVRDGHSRVLDGPFAETRELLAGFNLIRARDRDDAMRIARQFPWARFGSIEVRPLEDMDAERERCGAPAAMAAAAP